MHNKLASESTDGHSLNIGIGYFSSDSAEQIHERSRFQVVHVAIGQHQNPLLTFVYVIDLVQFH